MSNAKISIRFYDDREVRAIWDEENAKWWFSVLDIVAVLTDQNDYTKTRNYWKYLKAKLKKENSQVVSVTTQLKFLAPDGKKRFADMLDYNGIIALGKEFPGKKANRFIDWVTYCDESIDGKSKTKAYALFESSFIESIEVESLIKIRMKKTISILISLMALLTFSCLSGQEGKHLFILSGQSNMAGLIPEESFTPAIIKNFGEENVIVVKDAFSGQPIRRWYKVRNPLEGDGLKENGDLYDSLMTKVYAAIDDAKIATVTFIWMQGERDAREKLGELYEESLTGLYQQLGNDLERKDINFIIGRLSDFDLQNEKYPHWTMIRDIQVKVGESDPRFDWINTDDLNDGVNRKGEEINNDLHMSAEGYMIMGRRFAEKSIELIENPK